MASGSSFHEDRAVEIGGDQMPPSDEEVAAIAYSLQHPADSPAPTITAGTTAASLAIDLTLTLDLNIEDGERWRRRRAAAGEIAAATGVVIRCAQ